QRACVIPRALPRSWLPPPTPPPRFRPFLSVDVSAPTAFSPLSLHDALPILPSTRVWERVPPLRCPMRCWVPSRWPSPSHPAAHRDRKSTRLNSSHVKISYAVFCLKKKTDYPSTRHFCVTALALLLVRRLFEM